MHHHHAKCRGYQHQPSCEGNNTRGLHFIGRRADRAGAPSVIPSSYNRDRSNRRIARERTIVQRQDHGTRQAGRSFYSRFKDGLCFGARRGVPKAQGWLEDG